MTERLHAIRNNLINGIPYYGMDEELPREEFETLTQNAENACLAVHQSLYERFWNDDGSIVVFGDPDSGEENKYLSFADHDGQPLYGAWDPKHSATDIGVRGANPDFPDVANPTTIVHADTQATRGLRERGAPVEVVDAMDSVAKLNYFIEEYVVRPYLELVAEATAIERDTYLAHFFAQERGRRQRILTRVIMYHLNVDPQDRPIGDDDSPLLIKQHNDRSTITVDSRQTGPGLQYQEKGVWRDADTRVAVFRGTADSYLPIEAPPVTHRAVVRDIDVEPRLARVGIARIAIPTFVSPIGANVRVVKPSSIETHPSAM